MSARVDLLKIWSVRKRKKSGQPHHHSYSDMLPVHSSQISTSTVTPALKITSYKTLKTDYEWERFFSTDCDCELCAIYSKVLFHNITGIVRKELDAVHAQEAETLENQYRYVANITQLGKWNTMRFFALFLSNL